MFGKNKKDPEEKEIAKKEKKIKSVRTANTRKVFSGRTSLGLIWMAAAMLLILVVSPYINGIIGNKVEVVRVADNIYAGDKITEDKVKIVEVNRASLPEGAVTKMTDVVGKYTNAKLVSGDFVMNSKISDTLYGSGNYLEGLDGTKRVVSINIPNFAAGLSSKVQAGDIVSLYAAPQGGELNATELPELKYVKVLAVTLENGMDAAEDRQSTEPPTTITFQANEQQAKLLAGLNQSTTVHIVLVYRGEEDQAQKFLDEQDKTFKKSV